MGDATTMRNTATRPSRTPSTTRLPARSMTRIRAEAGLPGRLTGALEPLAVMTCMVVFGLAWAAFESEARGGSLAQLLVP